MSRGFPGLGQVPSSYELEDRDTCMHREGTDGPLNGTNNSPLRRLTVSEQDQYEVAEMWRAERGFRFPQRFYGV